MLTQLRDSLLNIDPEEVLDYAQSQGMDVHSLKDFRDQSAHYERIEDLMEDYRTSHARYSALGGLTTGIGGFTTSVTFAGIDTVALSYQLYRLAQRFAILNGFDGNDPLHRDKMMNIFFEALGINAVLQGTLKHQLLRAGAMAGSKEASENIILKLIVKVGKLFGRNLSSKRAGRLIPVVGGVVGAGANYSFARKTSKSMQKAFKRAYFDTWHDGMVEVKD